MQLSALTLRAWYERHFIALFHVDARPATIAEYQATLTAWELLTEDPPIGDATSLELAKFRAQLSAQPGRRSELASPATVNKHLRHVHHLFSKAGPPGPGNRDAMAILDVAPWAKPLRTFQQLPSCPTLESIGRMYRTCTCPQMRCMIVTLYNLGSRFGAMLAVRQRDVAWESREIRFCASIDKKRAQRRKPLSALVRSHLVALRSPRGDAPLFDFACCRRTLYRVWNQLQLDAGLTDEQRFGPHALKRACGTQLSAIASPWAVRYMLDHAQADVAGQAYIDPFPELRSAVERMPQPDAFFPTRQLTFGATTHGEAQESNPSN